MDAAPAQVSSRVEAFRYWWKLGWIRAAQTGSTKSIFQAVRCSPEVSYFFANQQVEVRGGRGILARDLAAPCSLAPSCD